MDDSVLVIMCLSKELWLVHGKITNEGSIKIKNKSWVEISLQTEFNFPRLPKIEQIYNLRFTSDWADVWLGWDQRWTNSKCLYLSCCNVCFRHFACVDNVGIGQLIKTNRQQFPLHTHCIQKCVEACIWFPHAAKVSGWCKSY